MKRVLFVVALLSCSLAPLPQSLTIQQMINSAAEAGQSLVVIPQGIYQIAETIEAAPGVAMDMSGVTLNAVADVDVIHMAPRAHLDGVFINVSGVTFTHDVLLFDGVDHFDTAFPTRIENVQLLGNWQGDFSGTGIRLHADTGYVMGVSFSNVGMSYFQDCLILEDTETAWVTANQFANITLQRCIEAITVSGGGNQFVNVQFQPDEQTTSTLYVSGDHNQFSNFFIWDWGTGSRYAIELIEQSHHNVVEVNLNPYWISDTGTTNKVLTPET